MLKAEALWLANHLKDFPVDRLSPMLDVGSASRSFRVISQPWIEEEVFAPLARRGVKVLHMDARENDGVDIVCDVSGPDVEAVAAKYGFKSVFCSNLLEHVEHPDAVAARMVSLVADGGYIFCTCPYRYPFHPDPIDTMFRPSVTSLSALFTGTSVVAGDIVEGERYVDVLKANPRGAVLLLVRLCFPFFRPRNWLKSLAVARFHLPWMWKRFEAGCVVLKKNGVAS